MLPLFQCNRALLSTEEVAQSGLNPWAGEPRQAFLAGEELLHEALSATFLGLDQLARLLNRLIPRRQNLRDLLLFGEWGERVKEVCRIHGR